MAFGSTQRESPSFREWVHTEVFGAVLLIAAAAIALIWANSPFSGSYSDLWHLHTWTGTDRIALPYDLHAWVNDGLMAIFFFVVGLEIKRELVVGELSSRAAAILPVSAAIGGVLVPALIYLALNLGHPGQRGWGIPTATDIAFALGVLALLGSSVPVGVKVFLGALAIVDDLAAILLIAVAYSSGVGFGWLLISAGVVLVLVALNRFNVQNPIWYLLPGLVLWLAVYNSGIHATIAGVLLAFTIPIKSSSGHSLGERMEHALHPISSWFIVPIFALANAGIKLNGSVDDLLLNRVALGVMGGLVLGKTIGIVIGAWVPVRMGWGKLPEGSNWTLQIGAAMLGGIGFTMSLLINELAFADPNQSSLRASAQIGVLSASIIAGVLGLLVLRRGAKQQPRTGSSV